MAGLSSPRIGLKRLIHSFVKHLLSAYFLPDPILEGGNTEISKVDKCPSFMGLTFCWGDRHSISKQINKRGNFRW